VTTPVPLCDEGGPSDARDFLGDLGDQHDRSRQLARRIAVAQLLALDDDELLDVLRDALIGRVGAPALYTSTGARVPPCPAPVEAPEPPAARVLAEDDGGAACEPTHRAGLMGKQSRPVQPQTPHATGP